MSPGEPPQRPGLVGRRAELAGLRAALDRAAAGEGELVLITGEPGIGKSRLAEEFCAGAEAAGRPVLRGACSPVLGARPPLGPVLELIDDIEYRWPDLVAGLPPEVAAAVRQITGRHLLDVGGDTATARLHAAVTRLVEAAGRRQPVVVVVEDVHWADPASLDVLAFLTRRIRRLPVLLLATSRAADTAPAEVRRSLAELRRLPGTDEFALAPLTSAETRELVTRIGTAAATQVDRIVGLSDGIPFYAVHLARSPDGRPVPAQLAEVLLDSVAALDVHDRHVLLQVAVAGEVDEGDLVGDAGTSDADATMGRLLAAGMIAVDGRTVRCRHALLRETVITASLPGQRRAAHDRAAGALLRAAGGRRPEQAAAVAHHLRSAGRDAEALPFALRAGRHAIQVWAFQDAWTALDWLATHWPGGRGALVDGTGYPEVVLLAAAAGRWCGRIGEGLALLGNAVDTAGLQPSLRVAIAQARGDLLSAAGDPAGALAAYELARELLSGIPDAQHAAVLAALAKARMTTGRALAAGEAAHAAIAVADACGAERERVSAAITLAVTRCQLGAPDRGVDELRAALRQACALDDLELVLRGYGNLTYALGVAGRNDEVADVAGEGVAFCRRYGPVLGLASTLRNNQLESLIAAGRWDEAIAAGREALEEASSPAVAMLLAARMAEIAVARGDLDLAAGHLAATAVLDPGNVYAVAAVTTVRCDLAIAAGDPTSAIRLTDLVLPVLTAADDPVPLLEVCAGALRAGAEVVESAPTVSAADDVSRLWNLAEAAHRRTPATSVAGTAAYLSCVAEHLRSSGHDTAAVWSAAEEAHGRLGRPYRRAQCAFRVAVAELRQRSRVPAAAALRRAREIAERLAASPLLAEIDELIGLAGLELRDPAVQRSAAAGDPLALTARERDVLLLMADGATNRVIGRRLHISERTAGVHVSHILGKLGASNRTEAARLARRRGLV